MRVRYMGPGIIVKDGKQYMPGDVIDLSEAQLAVMAVPPAGSGSHHFEMSDNQTEKVHAENLVSKSMIGVPEHQQMVMKAYSESGQKEEAVSSRNVAKAEVKPQA